MVTAVISSLFGLLTLVTLGAAVIGVAALAARRSSGGLGALRAFYARHALGAAAAVTGTATLGSLYYSEIAGYPPCALCWYQRIFVYALAVVLTTALVTHLWRSRGAGLESPRGIWASALPLAAIGLPISAYHIVVQRLPDMEATACDVGVPCSAIFVQQFGFVTIPVMAFAALAFTLVAGITAIRTTDPLPDGDGATSVASPRREPS